MKTYKFIYLLAVGLISGLTHALPPNHANLTVALSSPKTPVCRFGLANCMISLKAGGIPRSIEITNNSGGTALNITATLPATWTDVSQDASACTSLAVGNSCIITFTALANTYAVATIPVSGNNSNTVFFDMEVI